MFCTCVRVKCQVVIYCYSQNLDAVSVNGTSQPATFTQVKGDADALACCDVDRSTIDFTCCPFDLSHYGTLHAPFAKLLSS